MRKIILLLTTLVAGFGLALLAAGVSSFFFTLLPIIGFILGYFSSWRWGLLCGFLLFAGYTFTISVIWYGFGNSNLSYPIPYIGAFIAGGFSIPLIGALAPAVKEGVKKRGSIPALVFTAIVIVLCTYMSLPRYGYYYQIDIRSQKNLENLEVYLPVGAVSGEPYKKLYDHVYKAPRGITMDFKQDIVTTEYGRMLKLTIPHLDATGVPMPKYVANIIFWEKHAPYKLIQLMPKNGVKTLNTVMSQVKRGPVTSSKDTVIEKFDVPVKIMSNTPATVILTLENRTDRGRWVNFAYGKSYPYAERGRYEIQTGDAWVSLVMESTVFAEIRGISD